MGRIMAVCVSEKRGTQKKNIQEAELIEDFGIAGDAHAGKWHRQVSLLAIESIEKSKGMPTNGLCHGVFAENITTQGIELYTLPVGTQLQIGEAVIEITQIGKECHEGCAIQKTVGKCIMPKEGVFAKVIKGGNVYNNDPIQIL